MEGMPPAEVVGIQCGDVQGRSLQLIQGATETVEICGVAKDNEINVSTELGGAVHDARLTAHEKRSHPVRPES